MANISKYGNMDLGKIPPQAIELEEVVLGAIMLNSRAMENIEFMESEYFYKDSNKLIFSACKILYKERKPIDLLTVTVELKRLGNLDLVGGAYAIALLTSRVSSAENIEYHCKIILQKYIERELIRISLESCNIAYKGEVDVFEQVELHENQLKQLMNKLYDKPNEKSINQITANCLNDLTIRENNAKQGKLTGISTGSRRLNEFTNGWQKSDLIIIAGRPGMGKTSLALHFAKEAGKLENVKAFIFSLEMNSERLVDKIIIAESNINSEKYKSGWISGEERIIINEQSEKVKNYNIHIDDTSAAKILYIRTQLKLAQKKLKPNEELICFIDYLQLINGETENKHDNREREIAKISAGCKAIAKDLNIPVILLAQLSRLVEQRGGNKRPVISDLRESGAIEQDADLVLLLYRPQYYGINENESGDSTINTLEIIIGKHRNGNTGTVKLNHNDSITKFWDYIYPTFNNEEPF